MDTSEGKALFTPPGIPSDTSSISLYYTWYKTIGDVHAHPPLIFLYGGPGAGHDDHYHLAEALLAANIPSIWYDQLGCGNSSRTVEKAEVESFWTWDLFCAELDNLVSHLGLTKFYILGHSWGGMLASTYAARRCRSQDATPSSEAALLKVIISCSYASSAVTHSELERRFRALPVSEEVMDLEAKQSYDDPVYVEAFERFSKKHFCTLDPLPPVLTSMKWEDSTRMWPPSKNIDGVVQKGISAIRKPALMGRYDATQPMEAPSITVPVLLISGRHDALSEAVIQPWVDVVKDVRSVVMENSAHFPSLEEEERYSNVVKQFLNDQQA